MTSMSARGIVISAITAAAAALAAVLVLILSAPSSTGSSQQTASVSTDSATGFAGAAIPLPERHPFTLSDQSGGQVSLATVHGQVAVLAFVSPGCGRTCVLIAQQVRGALDELSRPVPVLLVSVEPAADTPARVARFLAQVSLTGRALYLSGTATQLARVWHAYSITPPGASRAGFEGSAQVVLLDRAGRERVVYGLEQLTPEALSHDIRRLGS